MTRCNDGQTIRSSSSLLAAVSPLLRQILQIVDEDQLIILDLPSTYMICFLDKVFEWQVVLSKLELYMLHSVLAAFGVQFDSALYESVNTLRDETIVNNDYTITDATNMDDDNIKSKKKTSKVKTVYRCDKCMKQFTINRDFMNHINAHFGIKPYPCKECDKTFTQKSHLNTHMHIHTGVKKYVCYKCGRMFNVSSNLKKHLAVHSRNPDEAVYSKQIENKSSSISIYNVGDSYDVVDNVVVVDPVFPADNANQAVVDTMESQVVDSMQEDQAVVDTMENQVVVDTMESQAVVDTMESQAVVVDTLESQVVVDTMESQVVVETMILSNPMDTSSGNSFFF